MLTLNINPLVIDSPGLPPLSVIMMVRKKEPGPETVVLENGLTAVVIKRNVSNASKRKLG